jgi:hypothetical protein
MINNIPKPNTYKKEYLEASSRVRAISIQNKPKISIHTSISKGVAKSISKQVNIKTSKINIPSR